MWSRPGQIKTIGSFNPTHKTDILPGLVLNVDAGNASSYSGGSTWTNLVGNGNNITLTGSPTYDGTIGSITFNGSSQYGSMTTPALLPTGNTISVVVWSYSSATSGAKIIDGVDSGNNTTFAVYAPYTDNSVYWDTAFYGGNATDRIQISVGAGWLGWHQWAFTKNATTGVMNIYRDGAIILATTGHTRAIQTSAYCLISATGFGTPSSFKDGKISQIQISNVTLTDAQILANFTSYRSRYGI